MEDTQQHLNDLKEIRSMMERSSRFISLSGLSGIFAGIFALAGAAAAWWYLEMRWDFPYDPNMDRSLEFLLFFIADASTVLILAISFAIFFTTRQARKKGQKIFDKTTLRLLSNIALPLATGGFYCLALLYYAPGLVAPSMLIFYGLALLNGSKYTLNDIRYLGVSEIILGLINLLYLGYGLLFWALGFGILHILYGTIMYFKYEK
ncbi:MAG TPA: hypothetical protein VIK89_08360 [Cytophagaceae bacterium]